MSREVTRRGFLWTGLGATLGAAAAGQAPPAAARSGRKASRVVLVRRPEVVDDEGRVDAGLIARMLDEGVVALTGAEGPEEAWRRLVGPGDVVGVKSNEWSRLPTPPELEDAVRSSVLTAGVGAGDVAVDDRGVRRNPVFRRATAIVNVRPMRTHHWSGLGTCLKNMIMFVPRPADYHGDACATLGAIWRLPELDGKVRLNVLVMLTPQFHGVGPHSFSDEFVWRYGGLILGFDPAPVDATGARVIRAHRRLYFGEDRPISPPPHHIRIADERYGLGASDPDAIELVRIGEMDGALI